MTANHHEDAAKLSATVQRTQLSRNSYSIFRRNIRGSSSGGQIVAMMQAAVPGHGYDTATSIGIHHSFPARQSFVRQQEMRPVVVIVADVFVHQAFQMPFIKNDHVVEQIAAAVADPPLGNTVLPRTSEACSLRMDAEAFHCVDHFIIELCAAIKDQLAGRDIVRKRHAQLLDNPGAGRVFGHIAVQDAPPVMRNDEEAVEHAKGQRRHGEEVHCGNGFTMIIQKSRPSFAGSGLRGAFRIQRSTIRSEISKPSIFNSP